MSPKEHFYRKLARRMTWAFGISVTVTVFLLVFLIRELDDAGISFARATSFTYTKTPLLSLSIQDRLTAYMDLEYDQLIALLDDKSAVSDGYKVCDCALSILASKHFFYVDKALKGSRFEKQVITVNAEAISLFPGLTAQQYQMICDFARYEEFPYTFEGLFAKLSAGETSAALQKACRQNHTYMQIEECLNADKKLPAELVFTMIGQARGSDLSLLLNGTFPASRIAFLRALLPACPKDAAHAFLEVEYAYAVHSLDDAEVIQILDALADESKWTKEYALKIFLSPRQDQVRKAAALRLCRLGNLDPHKQTRESLLTHFGVEVAKTNIAQQQIEEKAGASGFTAKVDTKKQPAVPSDSREVDRSPVKQPSKTAYSVTPSVPSATAHTKVAKDTKQRAQATVSSKAKGFTIHIVRPKENLWTISKKYKVDIEAIKKLNHLTSDRLSPGTALKIPSKIAPQHDGH